MPRSRGRAGRPWERIKAQVFAEESICWLCGKPVDQTLTRNHPAARVVDHVLPLAAGADPLDRRNLRLAHRLCNGQKGARIGQPANPTSRRW